MIKEDVLDLLMLSVFVAPILVGILSLLFKKWKKISHYLLISLAVLLVVTFLCIGSIFGR